MAQDSEKNQEQSFELSTRQYNVYKDWYLEAHRYPKYILTVDLAFLAFEGSNFLVNSGNTIGNHGNYIMLSMLFLFLSGISSGAAMLFCYFIFETGVRNYLSSVTWRFSLKPNKNMGKLRKRGFIAWFCFDLSLLCLFLAVGLLAVFSYTKINTTNNDDCKVTYQKEKPASCYQRDHDKAERE